MSKSKHPTTPEERTQQGQHRKIQTMIDSLVNGVDEKWITIEELKYVVREVERKLKARKLNGKTHDINSDKK